MSKVAIRVERLGKKYRIGEKYERYKTLRDTLADAAGRPFRAIRSWIHPNLNNGRSAENIVWALKDVSFEIQRGEVVGIIGRNGAGKSTLLKILSGITEPTEGYADIHGRVGSLLEVGTGFHPELTGRENIYLNGAILGMKRAEIARKFDEIVAFAENEKFIDTAVKHYSTGMHMRLAFAVAAHLDPEILLVDEVLAVGDAQFQKKCLRRISDVARAGRTVLFVSHNMSAVRGLCGQAIWLRRGGLQGQGEVTDIVSSYLAQSLSAQPERKWTDLDAAPGNNFVRLRRASVCAATEDLSSAITVRTPIRLEFEYWNLVPGSRLNLSLVLRNEEGTVVLNTFPVDEPVWNGRPFPVGLFRSACYIPGNLLNSGGHGVQLLVVKDQNTVLFVCDDIVTFELVDVRDAGNAWHGKWIGAVRPKLEWSTELLNSEEPLRTLQEVHAP